MNQPEAEAVLLDGLQRQLACYARADAAARDIAECVGRGEDVSAGMDRLTAPLDEAARLGAALAPVKELWQHQAYRPGPALQTLLRQLAEAVAGVAERVVVAQQAATARRDLLWPQLEELARAQRMRRAYGAGPPP